MSKVLRVFVASPDDVLDARVAIEEVADELNDTWGPKTDLFFQVLDWRKHVTPYLALSPQTTLYKQLPVESWDVFVGILWSRLGTPTGNLNHGTGQPYRSGTEEEFDLARQCNISLGRPKLLFYKCTKAVAPDINLTQLQLVQSFFQQFGEQGAYFGLYDMYSHLDEFRKKVRRHLTDVLLDLYLHLHEKSAAEKPAANSIPPPTLIRSSNADLNSKLERYNTYLDSIGNIHSYEIEALLWQDVQSYLGEFKDGGYDIANERSEWLRRNGLFATAESHYKEMLQRFQTKEIETRKSLGFTLLRQGKINEAITTFNQGRSMIAIDAHTQLADFENLLGQANQLAGNWDAAYQHYTFAVRSFTLAKNISGLAGAYMNRSFLYLMQGMPQATIEECTLALELLNSLFSTELHTQRRYRYAQMNLGTAYQYAGDHANASRQYLFCLEMARQAKDQEVLCYTLQQAGRNNLLWGKKLRNDAHDLAQSCLYQLQAWQYLIEAREIAENAKWQPAIAETLTLLGKVYEEIFFLIKSHELSAPTKSNADNALSLLQAKITAVPLSVEFERKDMFLIQGEFTNLTWLEKSARLYEFSLYVANQISDSDKAIENLLALANVLLQLQNYQGVSVVANQTEHLSSYEPRGEFFAAVSRILQADLDFEQSKYDLALDAYSHGYVIMAKQKGYAFYLLTDRLEQLAQKIRKLASEIRLHWCDVLEQSWLEQSISSVRPEMLRLIQDIRFNTVMES